MRWLTHAHTRSLSRSLTHSLARSLTVVLTHALTHSPSPSPSLPLSRSLARLQTHVSAIASPQRVHRSECVIPARTAHTARTCAPQYENTPIDPQLCISVDGFVVVYSVDDITSFETARKIANQVLARAGLQVPIVLVGNKTDLRRQVSDEDGTRAANAIGGVHIDACAVKGTNVGTCGAPRGAAARSRAPRVGVGSARVPPAVRRALASPNWPCVCVCRLDLRAGSSQDLRAAWRGPGEGPWLQGHVSLAVTREACALRTHATRQPPRVVA
jgi:hypothetical protein